MLPTFLQQSIDRQVEISSAMLPKWSTWHVITNKTFPPPQPSQPIIARRKQKTRKYGPTAEANHLDLCPAHTGEMDVIIKNFLLDQISLNKLDLNYN